MGQTRVVRVTRFIARNTIEKRILELQERKMRVAEAAFSKAAAAAAVSTVPLDIDSDNIKKKGRKNNESGLDSAGVLTKEAAAKERIQNVTLLLQRD